jgi:hypothetical protein
MGYGKHEKSMRMIPEKVNESRAKDKKKIYNGCGHIKL